MQNVAQPLQPREKTSRPQFRNISVALAVYNGEEHLQEQLESLARQDLLPFELVVTDDGSSDASLSIVRKFSETAPFPVYLYENEMRLGYGGNFLHAASRCKGDLIAFCDQDDVWLEPKLQTCSRFFDDPDVTVVVHSAEVWDGKANLGRYFPGFEQDSIKTPGVSDPLSLTPGFAMVFRRELLGLTNNDDRPGCLFGLGNGSIMAHDAWVWLLGTSVGKVATLKDVLALYRQHSSNTVGAPAKWNLARTLQLSAAAVDYKKLSRFEEHCAAVLSSISKDCFPAFVRERELLIEHFTRRAAMHTSRAEVYDRDSRFTTRAATFLSLLSSGAYFPNRSKDTLGTRAAIKDLSYGVSGLYKRFVPLRT